MSQKLPQKFRKSIFQVKKSNFYFISTNHSRMDCNLSSTLTSNIFAFLRSLHLGKATFTDYARLQATQTWNQKFRKSILFPKHFRNFRDFFWQIIFEHNFLHHKIIFFVLVFFPDKVWVCIFSFWHLHTPTTSLELRTMGIDLARIVPSFHWFHTA